MCKPIDANVPHHKIQHKTRRTKQPCISGILKYSSKKLCIMCLLLCYFTAGNYAEAANMSHPVQTTVQAIQETVQCSEDSCYIKISSSQQALKNMDKVSEYLFDSYAIARGSQKVIDDHGIEKFISDIGLIKEDEEHDHDHDHGHDHHHHHHHDHDADYWADIMADYFDEEDNEDDNATVSRKRRSEEEGEFPCFSSVEELVKAYFGLGESENIELTIGDFTALMPRILLDVKRPECRFQDDSHDHHDHGHDNHDHGDDHKDMGIEHNKTNIWLISFGSVIIISLVSLVGVLFIPLLHKSVIFNHLIGFLVALAVGTLIGDALLHLLPHASGLHDHSGHGHEGHDHGHEGHDHGHEGHGHGDEGHGHSEEEHDHFASMWKGLVTCAGIYVFFLLETTMGFLRKRKSFDKRKVCLESCDVESPSSPSQRGLKVNGDIAVFASPSDSPLLNHQKPRHHHGNGSLPNGDHTNEKVDIAEEPLETGHRHHSHKVPQTIASLAWMVVVGDGLHNLTDGLAIGAAFTSSIGAGLGTVLAIFFHEIPQELGDFAVLLNSGMTVKQAVLWNFISACTCFIGLLIGLLIGEYTTGIILWILAFTAGGFLYIALVDMLPAVMKQLEGKSYWKRFAIQNVGLLSGFAVMVLIGLKEEELAHAF